MVEKGGAWWKSLFNVFLTYILFVCVAFAVLIWVPLTKQPIHICTYERTYMHTYTYVYKHMHMYIQTYMCMLLPFCLWLFARTLVLVAVVVWGHVMSPLARLFVRSLFLLPVASQAQP